MPQAIAMSEPSAAEITSSMNKLSFVRIYAIATMRRFAGSVRPCVFCDGGGMRLLLKAATGNVSYS